MAVTEYDPPERFVAGTVGPPGARTFFLQARSGTRVSSMSLEKEQVEVLADRIEDLVDAGAGEIGASGDFDRAPLDTPIEDEFRVNTLSLAWDAARVCIIVECYDRDPEEDPAGTSVRVVMDPVQARDFVRRSREVVGAGRPPCPFCGGPIDLEGHLCSRANGYRR